MDMIPDAAYYISSNIQVGFRQDQAKFLSADPAQKIIKAFGRQYTGCELLKGLIPGKVTELIIHIFK